MATQSSSHRHHHPSCDSTSSQPVFAIPFSSMSKDSNTMKSSEQSSGQSTIRSALKSNTKPPQPQPQQDQREDSSSCDGNSIATPTGSLPQSRAVRFSPGVSSTTTGTSFDETLPDLPPLSGTRQPLGRKARQAQVRKLLQLASSQDTESVAVPMSSKGSKLS